MIDAIQAAQISMLQDQSRLQIINQNIANMQTPGYKRQLLDAVVFEQHLRPEAATVSQGMQNSQILTQGTLVQSQNAKDLAIAGEGFFTVQTTEGIFYTRRGDLHINEHGELCSATGGLILGQAGVLRVDDNSFTIDSQGTVYIENRKVDQLNLVQFNNIQALKYRGQGLFETREVPSPITSSTRVLQGYLEQANVKSVDEMLEMVKTSRHFEASQRVMQTADHLLSTAINQLGEGNV
ncbi:Distal rod protein [Legionella massiliensis]|uniref:Distal rod protein n=1 Tax=Legionella massiliensis TaxID=1034943 RepID=A0A078KZA6_9GAMM|nr:flagellar hook basal-body protein [Legionella massiliensis]CDZ77068.1 Distal rod protein [Legionella massiliensis]CEE12806.1 Flagellar basal-body rod protein FlgG [Legionella massiliensis]